MASILNNRGLSIQVCVPDCWTDAQVTEWANAMCLCGTTAGWQLAGPGDRALAGAPDKVACARLPGHVHRVLLA